MEPVSLVDNHGILLLDVYRIARNRKEIRADHALQLLYMGELTDSNERKEYRDILSHEFTDCRIQSDLVDAISVRLSPPIVPVVPLTIDEVLQHPEHVKYYLLSRGSIIPPEIAIYYDDNEDQTGMIYFPKLSNPPIGAISICHLPWIAYGDPMVFRKSLPRIPSRPLAPDMSEEEKNEASEEIIVSKTNFRTWKEYLTLLAVGMIPIGGPAICAARNFQRQRYIDASIDTGFILFDILTWGGSTFAKLSIKGMIEAFSKSALKETSKETIELGTKSFFSLLIPKLSMEASEVILNTTIKAAAKEVVQTSSKTVVKNISKELATEGGKRILLKCATEYLVKEINSKE